MSYRKLKAEYLFDGFTMQKDVVLLIREDGTIEASINTEEAGDGVERFEGILCPGFINCHCHLELSHMKGLIPEKLGLVNFVFSVVSQRNHSEEVKKEAIRVAELEMWTNGIVAVGDICNTADTLEQKTRNNEAGGGPAAITGFKNPIDYYNFIELFGWAPGLAVSRFEAAQRLASMFSGAGIPDNRISLSPHAPYSVSEPLWSAMEPGFAGKTITMHNQETAGEDEYFRSGTGDLSNMYRLIKVDTAHFQPPGSTSLRWVLPKLETASRLLLVHNTFTGEPDITNALKIFGDRLYFCLCPNANVYIENRLPDIPAFIRQDAQMVLGTDSLASNHQLSILEEIKTIRKAFPAVLSAELLVWATSNGAKALSFDNKLGSFSKGKKPGVLLIQGAENGEIGAGSYCGRIV